jgi:hypothetical protein
MAMPFSLTTIDSDLIRLETHLMSALTDMTPNVHLIQLMMEKVFNLPRNRLIHPENRFVPAKLRGMYLFLSAGLV